MLIERPSEDRCAELGRMATAIGSAVAEMVAGYCDEPNAFADPTPYLEQVIALLDIDVDVWS